MKYNRDILRNTFSSAIHSVKLSQYYKIMNLCCNRKKFEVSQDQTDGINSREKLFQVLYCTFANLSIISSGMGLGYPAITSQLLLKDSQLYLSESQVSWFASITAITCPLGGLLSGYLSDLIGRKRTLILIDIIAIISWIIIGFSSRVNVDVLFIQLMVSRTVIGVIIGMSTTPAVMYTSEVCDPNIRGRLTMLSSPFFTAFGMLLIYLLGYLIPVWNFWLNQGWKIGFLCLIKLVFRLLIP